MNTEELNTPNYLIKFQLMKFCQKLYLRHFPIDLCTDFKANN